MQKAPRAARAGFAAAALLLVLHALAYFLWTEDDAGVSLRYAANLAEGSGFVYNPGERIEAISNPGYALFLAPVYALLPAAAARPALLLAAKLLGILAALLTLGETRRLARACGLGPRATTVLLLLIAGSGPFAAWAVGALEVPFCAWASAALVAAVAESAATGDRAALRRAQIAAVALVWLRIDGFVLPLAMVALLALPLRAPRTAARLAGAVGLSLAVLFSLRLAYYGPWWPNPVHAKVDLATSLPRIGATFAAYLLPFLRLHGGMILTFVLAAAALTGGAPRPHLIARRVAGAAVAALALYTLLVGADWMPLYRFLVPAVVPLCLLLVSGAARLGARLRLSPAALVLLVLGLAGLEALAGHASFRTRRATRFWYFEPSFSPAALVAFWSPAVDWLQRHAAPGSLLLTSEAGFIPYLSGLRTVDSFGLAYREMAALPRGEVERSALGVHTRFIAGPPQDAAQRLVAGLDAPALVLQWRMVELWNEGRVPPLLFAGRYRLAVDAPLGGTWAIYVSAAPGKPTP